VFDMSLRQLDPAQRRMFQVLGLVPGEDIDAYGAAALAGIPLANARSLLEDLVDVHLVQEPGAGRYRMHDLLRQAARADDPTADPMPAIGRLADYYLSGLLAVKELIQVLIPLPVTVSEPPSMLPDLSGHDRAVNWMDTEWDNVTATFALAVQLRIDGPAVGLGQLATIAHAQRGGSAQLRAGLEVTLPAGERLADRRVLASHRYLLGSVLLRMGRLDEAMSEFEAARMLMAAEGDLVGEAMALFQQGEALEHLADAEGAVVLLERAIALVPPHEAAVRTRLRSSLSHALVCLGNHAEAREIAAELIETTRETDRPTARMCLDVLGRAAVGLGNVQSALDFAVQAVAVNQATRHAFFEAVSLTDVAVALLHLGRREEAPARQAEAVGILERAGEPDRLARIQLPYAEACLATGDRDTAARHFQEALELATAHGLEYLLPEARSGLARVSRPVPGHLRTS
jgi:tetratricopeptide (TPR) repeat protein